VLAIPDPCFSVHSVGGIHHILTELNSPADLQPNNSHGL